MRNVIPGFESLSAQQVFDMAARHVLKNGQPSMGANGICSYAGIGCAAAPFLTADARSTLTHGWTTLRNNGLVPSVHSHLIACIQDAHDVPAMALNMFSVEFIDHFKKRMTYVALDFKLNTLVLEETYQGK